MKKSYVAIAVASLMSIGGGVTAAPTSYNWSNATPPVITKTSFAFEAADLASLKYWAALDVKDGASGTLNDFIVDIKALGPKNGKNQDQQLFGIEVTGGSIVLGGDKLKVDLETDFIGGGNNQATAIDFSTSGSTAISAKQVDLTVASKAQNGKSVYGIAKSGNGTLKITSDVVNVNLSSATVRPANSEVNNDYSEIIGVDISGGSLITAENTALNIKVHSLATAATVDSLGGSSNKAGTSPVTGIKLEGGQGAFNGTVTVDVNAVGGSASAVEVTNYFYNTTLGQNYNDSAATVNKLQATASSKTGAASGILASYTKGSEVNSVILKVIGEADVTAETESGTAKAIAVTGQTTVEFDGIVTATAAASESAGTAYSIYTDAGTLSLQGANNTLNGDVSIKNASTLSLGNGSHVSQTALNGNLTADSGTTIELQNAVIDVAAGKTVNVATLTGSDAGIVLNQLDEGTLTVSDNKVKGLAVVASASANDLYADASEAAEALSKSIAVTNSSASGSYTISGQSGALSDGWTADEKGNITSRTTNQSLDVFGNYNAMTLVQWRNEVNHISQRLGDVRDSSATIGAWARVYGYDSSYDDNVSIDFKANSIQAGGDYRINNTWLVGGAFSYTDGEGKFTNGSADSDGYSLAAYLSGFFDCGAYVDFVGRIGRLSTDITAYSDASEFKGSYNNTTFGLSAEVGYHWKLNDTFYVEPQAELAYGFVKGDDFTGANDVRVEQDDFQTLVGRLGARIGASFADGAGTVYAHASVNHDFLGDADYTASLGSVSRDLSVDIGGTWVSYGIGAQFNTSKNLNFYGTLERANGSEYQEDYRYSVGMSYRF